MGGFDIPWWVGLVASIPLSFATNIATPLVQRWWANRPTAKRSKKITYLKRRIKRAYKLMAYYESVETYILMNALLLSPFLVGGFVLLILSGTFQNLREYDIAIPHLPTASDKFGHVIVPLAFIGGNAALMFATAILTACANGASAIMDLSMNSHLLERISGEVIGDDFNFHGAPPNENSIPNAE